VFGTNEATMDAKALMLSADLGVQKAKQLRMGQGGFDENEYVTRLISKMGGHEIDNDQQAMDWAKIGKIAMKWSRKAPTMDFMYVLLATLIAFMRFVQAGSIRLLSDRSLFFCSSVFVATFSENISTYYITTSLEIVYPFIVSLSLSRLILYSFVYPVIHCMGVFLHATKMHVILNFVPFLMNNVYRLGPMAVEHKTRTMAQRTRVVRDPKAMRKPQELREEDIARQENETTKNVMQINSILEQLNRKVNLFELVINPESFGQTVENIFYLSFLVRDGKASILEVDMADPNLGDVDEDGEPWVPAEGANIQPMVELTEVPTAEDYQGGLLKKQMVLEIDMATWRVSYENILFFYMVCRFLWMCLYWLQERTASTHSFSLFFFVFFCK
jgi:hypothetical protein